MTGNDERNMVDHFVERVGGYNREVVVNYYVALKSKRFVILTGSSALNKMRLAQGLAEVLVPQPSKQWSLLQAHPWWVTRSGDPARLAVAHARFSSLKLVDVIEEASASMASELQCPFFVGFERMSPAEAVCYFDDLPQNLLWRPDGAVAHIRVPNNLYVTGSLDVEEKDGLMPSQEVHRHAITIRLRQGDVTPFAEAKTQSEARPDWQAKFVGSAIQTGDQARAKLIKILADDLAPLAPLHELETLLGVEGFSPSVNEEAWVYVANAFDADGHGLFVEADLENVAIAQDHVLAQTVLPHVISERLNSPRVQSDEVREYLAPRFPRAYAWIQRLSRRSLNMPARRRAQSGSTNAMVGPGPAAARQTAD